MNTDEHGLNSFMEKLLYLSADQASGVEVEWKALGEVAEIGTGSHDTKDAIEEELLIGPYVIFYQKNADYFPVPLVIPSVKFEIPEQSYGENDKVWHRKSC